MTHEDVLPVTWKYYIAIMAISCYECEYLLKLLEEQFLLNGGNVGWLTKGFRKIDKKLERLSIFNEYMAYKPWAITHSMIEPLLKAEDRNLVWSIPELLQASAILAQYHSLCGLVFGQGLKDDTDIAMSFDKANTLTLMSLDMSAKSLNESQILSEEKTIQYLQKAKNKDLESEIVDNCEEDENDEEENEDNTNEYDISDQSNEHLKEKAVLGSIKDDNGEDKKREIFLKHRAHKLIGYVNFNNKEESYHDVGEFSWEF